MHGHFKVSEKGRLAMAAKKRARANGEDGDDEDDEDGPDIGSPVRQCVWAAHQALREACRGWGEARGD